MNNEATFLKRMKNLEEALCSTEHGINFVLLALSYHLDGYEEVMMDALSVTVREVMIQRMGEAVLGGIRLLQKLQPGSESKTLH